MVPEMSTDFFFFFTCVGEIYVETGEAVNHMAMCHICLVLGHLKMELFVLTLWPIT